MVLRERAMHVDLPIKRGSSVPAVHLHRVEELMNDWDVKPKNYGRISRIFHDSEDIINDGKFLRDIESSKMYVSSVHPPSPIILSSLYPISPLLQSTKTTYSVPHLAGSLGHVSRPRFPLHYQYRPSPSAVLIYPRSFTTGGRGRISLNGLLPRRRTAIDEEVEAFLASTPQSRYPSYTPSFRSISTPNVIHYNSYTNAGTPSYATQHLYRPPNWTSNSSGWTSNSLQAHHQVKAPRFARRPLSVAGSAYRSVTPEMRSAVSKDWTYSSKPLMSSAHVTHIMRCGDENITPSNPRLGRSRSQFVDVVSLSQFERKPRSASVALGAPHSLVNYKDVKAPMSDTRKKVRDLICKTRKDPNYYA